MNTAVRIPIFPLPLVVCPREPLPLHIFEPRYKELIRCCRERARRNEFADFGILYQNHGQARIGSTVRLCSVLKEYDDGRLEIMTLGQQRFQVLRILHEAPYDEAEVLWLADERDDWNETLATEAFTLHRKLIKAITGKAPSDCHYTGQRCLSLHLAQSCGMTFEQKQQVLQSRSEDERLGLLIDHLKDLLPMLECVDAARQSIHNNWALHQYLKGERSA